MYGYYNIPRGFVVMCQGFHKGDFNELVDTLKHEGWHAVQQQCRNGAPFLSQQQIASRISRQDAFNVHNYHPKQQYLESEARIIAKVNDKNWMRLVKQECRGKHKKRYTNRYWDKHLQLHRSLEHDTKNRLTTVLTTDAVIS